MRSRSTRHPQGFMSEDVRNQGQQQTWGWHSRCSARACSAASSPGRCAQCRPCGTSMAAERNEAPLGRDQAAAAPLASPPHLLPRVLPRVLLSQHRRRLARLLDPQPPIWAAVSGAGCEEPQQDWASGHWLQMVPWLGDGSRTAAWFDEPVCVRLVADPVACCAVSKRCGNQVWCGRCTLIASMLADSDESLHAGPRQVLIRHLSLIACSSTHAAVMLMQN